MGKAVWFNAAIAKAGKFGKRPRPDDHFDTSHGRRLQFPPIRKDLADLAGVLIVWLTAAKARLENAPAPAAPSANVGQRLGLEGRAIHRTVRGDMVRSKSKVAIANILFSLEWDGGLKYQIEPELPFQNHAGTHADFKLEAKGATFYWEHCDMPSNEACRRRFEQKKALYEKNGFSVNSAANPSGRLIVTEDSLEDGIDTQAIDALARKLFYS